MNPWLVHNRKYIIALWREFNAWFVHQRKGEMLHGANCFTVYILCTYLSAKTASQSWLFQSQSAARILIKANEGISAFNVALVDFLLFFFIFFVPRFFKFIVTCKLCGIYVGEDKDSNVALKEMGKSSSTEPQHHADWSPFYWHGLTSFQHG